MTDPETLRSVREGARQALVEIMALDRPDLSWQVVYPGEPGYVEADTSTTDAKMEKR